MKKRPEVLLFIAVGVIVGLAVVAVFVSRSGTTYSSGSPEQALQSYLESVLKGDKVAAFSYISSDSPCTQQDMDNAYVVDVSRVDVESSAVTGDRARIQVRFEMGDDFLFSRAYPEKFTFQMVKESSGWKITDGAWPMYSCGQWVK